MMETGKLKIPIAATYSLKQASMAQAALKQPHPPGKFVLIP
jgi:NADPH:quinone reductase-like Zn-dependent oxidoreductase